MKRQLKTNYDAPKANITYFSMGNVLTETQGSGFELPDDDFSLRKLGEKVNSWLNDNEQDQ